MADRSGEFSFFRDIHVKNGWHLRFHKAYCHQNQTARTFRGVKSLETNQTSTGDVII